jgi:LacI family transcriptional regulator
MLRLLIISDFTEAFPSKLLKGIVQYSRRKEQWIICRMPPAYKKMIGIPGVVRWAKSWGADAVIGQFEETDDVGLFAVNGIVAVAQDFKQRFSNIPNITADYIGTGRMGARFFLKRGFRHFAFFGFRNVCWSDERCDGFWQEVEAAGHGNTFYTYNLQDIDNLWFYEQDKLTDWLRAIPKPIGIMACDDNQGNNLVEACHAAGIKIPSEVSILGVDNDELLCNLGSTPLSSIQVNIEEGGYQTAALIEQRVLHPETPLQDVVLKPVKIIGRMSTATYATQDDEIQKAIQFIHRNVMKKISVEDVTAEVALSRRLLERRFKKVTDQTIYQYITDVKLKQFAQMLLDTDDQLIDIALALGETDTKSISRRFKQLYGCSPIQWREKNQTIR